jgi:hypothetical protein
VFFVAAFLVASYRNICRMFPPLSSLASLALATWAVLVFYNMTEAAFLGGLLWMMLLMGAVPLADRAASRVRNVTAFNSADTAALLRLETKGVRAGHVLQ